MVQKIPGARKIFSGQAWGTALDKAGQEGSGEPWGIFGLGLSATGVFGALAIGGGLQAFFTAGMVDD